MKRLNLVLIILLAMSVTALATTETAQAKGKPIKVEQAVPNVGEQSTEILPLLIKGRNLPKKALVLFRFNNPINPGDDRNGDVEQVVVLTDPGVELLDTGDLKLSVKVEPKAFLGDYDIEVYDLSMSGRMGKGTTMSKVQAKATGEFSLNDIWVSYFSLRAWEEDEEGYQDRDWFDSETWVNHSLSLEIPRPCYVGFNGNPPSAGRYDCDYEDNIGGMMSIDLAGIAADRGAAVVWTVPQNHNRKTYPGFCDLLNRWTEWKVPEEPLSIGTLKWYNITFSEGCFKWYCPVKVHTQSYSGRTKNGYIQLHQFRNLTSLPEGIDDLPDVGQLHVNGYTEADWAVNFPGDGELNVFTEPQILPIDRFEIKFFGDRHLNVLATCETVPGALSDSYVEFLTVPQGYVPDGD